MKYKNTVKGKFVSRPNRFIAHVEVEGEIQVCHVKNTGRCRELLVPGATVILEVADNPERKTGYDLIAVYKNGKLINMDSQAPNKVFGEWVGTSSVFGKVDFVRQEVTFGASRFDFLIEAEGVRTFVEVKGVTLERDGVVMFPDAPTTRGLKHIRELVEAKKQGFGGAICFVIQMEECLYLTPNRETHAEFADALAMAKREGVEVIALLCKVEEDSLRIHGFAPVVL